MGTIRFGFGFSIFVLVFFVASLFSFLPDTYAAQDFHQWCQKTTHTGTCIYIIQADQRSNLKTSPSGFCTILHDKAKAIATAAATKIATLLKSATDPQAKRALQECADLYNQDLLPTLNGQNFFVVFNRFNYQSLNLGLGGVADDARDCEHAIKTISPPLAIENQNLQTIAITASEILNLEFCNKTSACY